MNIFTVLSFDDDVCVCVCECVCTYTGVAVAVSHDEVERSTGLTPVLINGAAAVLKHLLAKVRTLLCLLLKQQVPKLHAQTMQGDTHKHTHKHSGLHQQFTTHTGK